MFLERNVQLISLKVMQEQTDLMFNTFKPDADHASHGILIKNFLMTSLRPFYF